MVTFPRSGVNYFADFFYQLTGQDLPRSHEPMDSMGKQMFSIVRNPVDTIASATAMYLTSYSHLTTEQVAESFSKQYYAFYSQILNNGPNLIIDYEKFIENPSKVLLNFIQFLGIRYRVVEYKNELKNHDDYIVSSKTSSIYSDILNYTKTLDLSNHTKEYELALARSVFS
jgi:hypothetical protein